MKPFLIVWSLKIRFFVSRLSSCPSTTNTAELFIIIGAESKNVDGFICIPGFVSVPRDGGGGKGIGG